MHTTTYARMHAHTQPSHPLPSPLPLTVGACLHPDLWKLVSDWFVCEGEETEVLTHSAPLWLVQKSAFYSSKCLTVNSVSIVA